ncbi:hypothetical protein ANACOL_02464 [Anaerotruncus colihominis DSM 17241]|uniref:Uncharacterized protein n=1 Tax=Anaerotruncus colihominis DSM 17241 TaxID=445972 RepID=B0PCF5_9FIRM|nr:hypothetical protein ANACOL_02464 [Anaerotruncus colihominis DSM 17241]
MRKNATFAPIFKNFFRQGGISHLRLTKPAKEWYIIKGISCIFEKRPAARAALPGPHAASRFGGQRLIACASAPLYRKERLWRHSTSY